MKKLIFTLTLFLLLSLSASAAAEFSYSGGVLTAGGDTLINKINYSCVDDLESLHTLVIEEGVTAFNLEPHIRLNRIKKLVLPSTLEYISEYGALNYPALEEIVIEGSDKFFTEDGVLFEKTSDGVRLAVYPAEKKADSYTLPENVVALYNYAFSAASETKEIRVNCDVSPYAFEESKIKKIVIGGKCKTIGKNAFFNCTSLEEAVLSEGIESMGSSVFYYCTALKEITLPESLKEIGKRAFYCCEGLEKAVVKSFLHFPEDTFAACINMKELSLEKGASWESTTFISCLSLKKLYIGKLTSVIASVPTTVDDVFYGGSEEEWNAFSQNEHTVNMHFNADGIGEATVHQPVELMKGVRSGYVTADKTIAWTVDGNDVLHVYGNGKIPSRDKTNSYYLWDSSNKPWTLVDIETENGPSFTHDLYYNGAVVHEGITEIGDYFFSQNGFKTISLPSTINSLGSNTFFHTDTDLVIVRSDCLKSRSFATSWVKEVVLTSKVKHIPDSCFTWCFDHLQKLIIPKSVTSIGLDAFPTHNQGIFEPTEITGHIYYAGSEEDWNNIDKDYVEIEHTLHFDALPFIDVTDDMWHFDYVKYLYEKGIVGGMTEYSFEPDGTLTWGQALKILLLSSGEKEPSLSGSHWASGYLTRARQLGLIEGEINPDDKISRLDFCKVTAKAKGITAQPDSNPFTDTDDKAVLALYRAGVIGGMSANTFCPNETLTRGQIAKIIYFIDKL
ncbi:MAG: leucine-rich repeat protein [Clostridia bacterium]|nr:leucine-rich repeat protein [Clostridia bacterium]